MRQISHISILLMLIVLFSCKKKEISANEISAYAECDTYTKTTESAVVSKLVGSWTWVRKSCYWNPQVVAANKNITVIFNANASFSVLEDGNTLTQGTWKVETRDNKVWRFDLSEESAYLGGYILFCNTNEVSFNSSDYDGCDFTFVKK
jgi:hypothetical protein